MATAQSSTTGSAVSVAASRTPLEARAASDGVLAGQHALQLGVLITLLWVGVAVLAPWIAPYNPLQG